MLLQLLNIESFVERNKISEIKTYKIPSKVYDDDGLWSESIFGPIGSKSRNTNFGYIDLKTTAFHPIVLNLIKTVSTETSQILNEKNKFIVQNKRLVSDPNGETGVSFLISVFNDIDLRLFCHAHKKKAADYLEKYKNVILINKFLVTPAGLRDVDIYNKNKRIVIEEINSHYTKLLIYINQLIGIRDVDYITIKKIQNQLYAIVDYIKKNKMTGKKGLFRGAMLRKSLDYSARLVLTNSPNIKFGEIGLPWHTLVIIFEPFVIHYLFKKEENINVLLSLKDYLKNPNLDENGFSSFSKDLILNPDIIPDQIKTNLISILDQFLSNQVVMCKRDPVVQRKSWFSATPVITEGRVAYVNSLDLSPIGGDSDGDTVAVLPIFTNEAKEEVKAKLNPLNTKSKWKDISSYSGTIYAPSLDAIATIYTATEF